MEKVAHPATPRKRANRFVSRHRQRRRGLSLAARALPFRPRRCRRRCTRPRRRWPTRGLSSGACGGAGGLAPLERFVVDETPSRLPLPRRALVVAEALLVGLRAVEAPFPGKAQADDLLLYQPAPLVESSPACIRSNVPQGTSRSSASQVLVQDLGRSRPIARSSARTAPSTSCSRICSAVFPRIPECVLPTARQALERALICSHHLWWRSWASCTFNRLQDRPSWWPLARQRGDPCRGSPVLSAPSGRTHTAYRFQRVCGALPYSGGASGGCWPCVGRSSVSSGWRPPRRWDSSRVWTCPGVRRRDRAAASRMRWVSSLLSSHP